MRKIVAVNEHGRRIGESHPRAKLTDHEVDLIRELAEQGLTHEQIARKFELSDKPAPCASMPKRTVGGAYVGRIVRCERRGQSVAGHKVVAKEKDTVT